MQLDPPFLRTVVVGEPGTIDPYGYWRGMREIDEAGRTLVTRACAPSGAPALVLIGTGWVLCSGASGYAPDCLFRHRDRRAGSLGSASRGC
jgi:hypothetical protein